MRKLHIAVHFSFILFILYFLWIDMTNKCNMSRNLMDLLGVVSEILDKHHIICYLCWGKYIYFNIRCNLYLGSLLGYIRNNELPPQDYDVDIVMNPHDYNRIYSLKNEFKKRGYTLYGIDDLLPGYIIREELNIISFRLYNDITQYFLEFFEGYTVRPYEVYFY